MMINSMYRRFFLLILFLSSVASVNADDGVYTVEEIIKKDGYIYDKRTNKPVNGILKIYFDSGLVQKEIELMNGVRHGVSKSYYPNGNLLTEWTFDNETLISGVILGEDGDEHKLSEIELKDYNSSNPNSPEAKAAAKEAEVIKKINAAIKEVVKKKYDVDKMTNEERFKKSIELSREAFNKAGYDYFETIKKVADDMRDHRENVLWDGESRHKLIVMLLSIEMSECEYAKVDCLQLYPQDTQESVLWLWNNTEFDF